MGQHLTGKGIALVENHDSRVSHLGFLKTACPFRSGEDEPLDLIILEPGQIILGKRRFS